jgi:hypothetical protein
MSIASQNQHVTTFQHPRLWLYVLLLKQKAVKNQGFFMGKITLVVKIREDFQSSKLRLRKISKV